MKIKVIKAIDNEPVIMNLMGKIFEPEFTLDVFGDVMIVYEGKSIALYKDEYEIVEP